IRHGGPGARHSPDLLRVHHSLLVVASEEFERPFAERVVQLADLVYYWDRQKADAAKAELKEVVVIATRELRATLGAIMRGEAMPKLDPAVERFLVINNDWEDRYDSAAAVPVSAPTRVDSRT